MVFSWVFFVKEENYMNRLYLILDMARKADYLAS